jgi:hypothetical protein
LKKEIFVTMCIGVFIVIIYESFLSKKMSRQDFSLMSVKNNCLIAGWNAFLFFLIVLFGVSDSSTFIYFQF